MDNDGRPSVTRDQDKVWDYYQTEGVSIFEFAVPRLAYLFNQARRFAGGRPIRILNIGTGNGWLEKRCQEAGWESWGLDPNPAAIQLLDAQGISGVVAGIESIPISSGSFDIVVASEVLEHLLDDLLSLGLGEIHRILKPGGIFLGTVPYQEPLELRRVVCPQCFHVHHAFGHHQSFSRKRLTDLFSTANLQPQFFRTRAFPGFRRRNLTGKLKSVVWTILGPLGAQAADAKIVFSARR